MEAKTKELYSADTAPEVLLGLLRARVLSSAICAVAELGVADHLTNDGTAISQLASATGTDEQCLYRLLRCLAMAGLFEETDNGCFSHTPLSEALRSASDNSLSALAIMDGKDWFKRPIDGLAVSVRTGEPSFDTMFGMDWVQFFREHPEDSATMQAGLEAATLQLEAPVLDRYDLSWAKTVADVGGGTGAFLAGVLKRNPHASGILAELEEIVGSAQRNLEQHGLSGRCKVVAIDMFEAIPIKADACLVKRVVHDWSDEKAIKILRNCKDVIAPTGRIAVIEPVVTGLMGALMDVAMMAFGGRERTPDDFERLFNASGLKLSRIIPVTPLASVVEGTVA